MILFFALWISGWAFVSYQSAIEQSLRVDKAIWVCFMLVFWPVVMIDLVREMRWNQRLIVVMGIAAIVSVVMGWDTMWDWGQVLDTTKEISK